MINRLLLLLTFVLLSTGALRAQNQEPLASATFKQRLRGQYLHNDTAQAIINLYSRRQAGAGPAGLWGPRSLPPAFPLAPPPPRHPIATW